MFRELYTRLFKTKKCISKRNALARRDVYPEDIKGKERNILRHLQLDNLRFKNAKNLHLATKRISIDKVDDDEETKGGNTT